MTTRTKPLRELQRSLTRKQILDTAESLFIEKGTAETSIEEVLEASGVSRATLYAHFAGKEGLLVGLAERMLDEAQGQYDALGHLPDWSLASLEGWLRATAAERLPLASRYRTVMAGARTFLAGPAGQERLARLVRPVSHRTNYWSHLEPDEVAVRSRMLVLLVEQQIYDLLDGTDPADEVDQFVRYTARAVKLLMS